MIASSQETMDSSSLSYLFNLFFFSLIFFLKTVSTLKVLETPWRKGWGWGGEDNHILWLVTNVLDLEKEGK